MSKFDGRLCVDASAIINLNASQCAPDILHALPERLLVVDIVVSELEEGRKTGREDAQMLAQLLQAQLIQTDSLGEPDESLFEALVSGTAATTLDDGEAATIAYAAGRSLPIVLDDQKARRIWQERFSKPPLFRRARWWKRWKRTRRLRCRRCASTAGWS